MLMFRVGVSFKDRIDQTCTIYGTQSKENIVVTFINIAKSQTNFITSYESFAFLLQRFEMFTEHDSYKFDVHVHIIQLFVETKLNLASKLKYTLFYAIFSLIKRDDI